MPHLKGVNFQALIGRTIVDVKHGPPSDLMPRINPYNAYSLVTEDAKGVKTTFIVWNAYGETNLSEVTAD